MVTRQQDQLEIIWTGFLRLLSNSLSAIPQILQTADPESNRAIWQNLRPVQQHSSAFPGSSGQIQTATVITGFLKTTSFGRFVSTEVTGTQRLRFWNVLRRIGRYLVTHGMAPLFRVPTSLAVKSHSGYWISHDSFLQHVSWR